MKGEDLLNLRLLRIKSDSVGLEVVTHLCPLIGKGLLLGLEVVTHLCPLIGKGLLLGLEVGLHGLSMRLQRSDLLLSRLLGEGRLIGEVVPHSPNGPIEARDDGLS